MKDLLCLVADRNIEAALRGLFGRPQALGIRALDFDIRVHPRRDPGCFREAHEFLRPFRDEYAHALVVFDRAWEGAAARDAGVLEAEVRKQFDAQGWKDWADVVVVEPELDAWVWSDSPHVEECLGWSGRNPRLRDWLRQENLWTPQRPKPDDPKIAVERALYEVRIPRSSAIYGNLASRVSVERCTDASFARFRDVLRRWFPARGGNP
jgi:hypothetical protein